MGPNFKRIATALGAVAAGAVAGAVVGDWRWRETTAGAVRRLKGVERHVGSHAFTPEALEGLPGPVVRYLQLVLRPGQALVSGAVVRQLGEFRMSEAAPWNSLTAVQHYSVGPPGFVWDACIRMSPLLTVRVRDSYLEGTAAMQAKLAALLPLVRAHHRPELNHGALQRYLAEAVWFPTAFLPGHGVTWKAVDDQTAIATLTDGPTVVSLEFRFGDMGEIVKAYTPARYREVHGDYLPTPWQCTYRSYAQHHAMTVPVEAEVAWLLPGGSFPYWKGRIASSEYS